MFERSETAGEIPVPDDGTIVATAQLPNLQIEVVHRALPDGTGERISIHLQAMPSFAAFGDFLEATNPLTFWTRAMQLAWAPWLSGQAMVPFYGLPRLKGPEPGETGTGTGRDAVDG